MEGILLVHVVYTHVTMDTIYLDTLKHLVPLLEDGMDKVEHAKEVITHIRIT